MKNQSILKGIVACVMLQLYFIVCPAQQADKLKSGPVPDLRIKLQSYTFDPLKQMPVIDQRMLLKDSQGETIYRLIQFKGPLTLKQMELLKVQYGLKLDRYIPNFAYLEKLSPGQIGNLQKLSFYRWTGNYEPAYKIEKELGTKKFVSPERKMISGLILLVVLFEDADAGTTINAIRKTGAQVIRHFEAPRSNRIRISVQNRNIIQDIAVLPSVRWIEEEGDITPDNGSVTGVIQSGNTLLTPVYDHGIHGEGQITGIIDAILDLNHCFFNDPLNPAAGPMHRKVVGYRQAAPANLSTTGSVSCGGYNAMNVFIRTDCGHGTHTSGTLAGFTAGGANNGIAFNSRLTYGDLNDVSFSGTGGSATFLEYLNAARDDGAFIHSNSWSDKATASINTYTTLSQDLDNFTWNNEDQLVVVSSGNNIDWDGDGTIESSPIRPPFSSKNGLCVAATDDPNINNVDNGALGPTFDNRRKPEIYAPGHNTTSALGGSNCGTLICTGTSMATPAVAGAATLVRQYYTEGWYPTGTRQPHNAFVPSGALLKATLLNSTRDMNGNDAFGSAAPLNGYPTDLEGWGRLVLDDALFFTGDARNLWVWDVRHSSGLNTGESHNYNINVSTNTQPLKITLVWMEPPATEASFASPVINNLNLTVTAPNGDVFRGNDFTNGQSTVNGAATDSVNNVEMALINTPQPGQYTIEISGTAVNTGNPGQGYALVVTADTEDPPVPTGAQNTLVVRTGLSDISAGTAPSLTTAMNLMTGTGNYISEVSYGTTTINPQYTETTLSQPSSYYYNPGRNVLIEMAQEVITNLVTSNPGIFTQGTPATNDDIARMIILINDPNFVGDWATTGEWPYDLPDGLTRRISVSVNSVHNDAEKRIEHAMCHQLGLVDLYAYPNVVFAQPHVDDWDIMANILNDVHPMAWSKERATWMTTHDPNSIMYIPRPAPGGSVNQTVSLDLLSSASTTFRKAVAIGLTPNAADLADEQVFYFIEARSNAATGKDSNVPEPGVLLYYVNENIRQGEGPVRIIDDVVTTPTLTDAALEVGDSKSPGGTGITVTVQSGTGGAAYNVNISYSPPATDNDVNIVVGDPAWISPDIWVDSQKNGFDKESGRTEEDRGDDPVINEINRIYFKIHNPGPGDAHDLTVFVKVSEPYHTVGGAADFNFFAGQKFYTLFPAGTDITDYVEWTPDNDGDPHSCIQVEIPGVFNDVNSYNNRAQQNTNEVQSSRSSPYTSVVYNFGVSNPYDFQQLIYFKTEGLPQGWTGILNPEKALLNPHQRIEGTLTVHPPDNALPCTEHRIELTSWMPIGNTLVKLGGGILQVDLRNRTDINLDRNIRICDKKRTYSANLPSVTMVPGLFFRKPECVYIETGGCTNPPRPNEEVIIRYQDPEGNPVYHTVLTDEYGCYSDTYVAAEGGDWKVSVEYPGNDCSGSAGDTGTIYVPTGPSKEANIYAGYFKFNNEFPVKSNLTFGLRLGYNFSSLLGIEGELGLTPSKDKNNMTGTVINANVNVLKYAVSGNMKLWPYAVVSAGTVWLKGFTNSTSYFTTAAGIGAKYYFSNLFALRAETKLFYFDTKSSAGKSVNQQYTIGLSYRF